MTANQIVRDAAVYRHLAPSHRPLRPLADDQRIARMDDLELNGKYDRDADGLRRSRRGAVGGVQKTCQVATMGNDTLLIFWSLGDGHQRRFLITGGGTWMDTGTGRAVQQATKYDAPIAAILAARAN